MRFRFTGVASGENWTMPKGMVAPGKTLPPFVVPTSGLTSDAGSGWAAKTHGEASRAASAQAKTELRASDIPTGYVKAGTLRSAPRSYDDREPKAVLRLAATSARYAAASARVFNAATLAMMASRLPGESSISCRIADWTMTGRLPSLMESWGRVGVKLLAPPTIGTAAGIAGPTRLIGASLRAAWRESRGSSVLAVLSRAVSGARAKSFS